MPNDCENKLMIRGTHEDLKVFVSNHIRQNEDNEWFLDFNTIIPEPNAPSECDAKYVMSDGETRHLQLPKGKEWFDWYSWRVDNWNTKWGAYDCSITENYDLIVVYYCTAWSPSIPIINKLIEMYPNLVFDYSYYECGCMLGGTIIGHNGRVTAEYECSINELENFAIEHGFEVE
jgi:hypothetical protein